MQSLRLQSLYQMALVLSVVSFLGLGLAHAETLNFSNGLQVTTTWKVKPRAQAENELYLQFKRTENLLPATPEETVTVELWMPSMGHGSRPTIVKPTLDASGAVIPGAFTVSKVYFVMGGEWDVRVHLTAANGQRETQILQLDLGGHGHH